MPDLPPEFIQTIQNAFQGKGADWLESLPALLEEASRRWNLTNIQPVPNLSYNFVAFARLDTESNVSRRWLQSLQTLHSPVILKLGVPQKELTSEIAALRLYNGRGACRLLDADPDKGMLLLERLHPGGMLSELEDDEQATQIAADVMSQLWRPIPDGSENFIQLTDWFDGFKRLRKQFDGKTGPLPEKLVEMAESLSKKLLSENKDEALLHGDFHHYNVLESARGWLAIDPKGVVGPRGYEVGPLLINPIHRFINGSNPKACPARARAAGTGERSRRVQTEKRIAILSERLGMERERIRDWAVCHAVLSAWWSLEDRENWEYGVRCAEILITV